MQHDGSSRKALLHSIARSLDNFKKLGKNNYTPAKIRSRISALKDTWTQCIQTHAALSHLVPEDKQASIDYFKDQSFDAHEDVYQNTLDYMAECLEVVAPAGVSNAGSNSKQGDSSFSLSHLPPINILPFTGKCDEWESFRDRFASFNNRK